MSCRFITAAILAACLAALSVGLAGCSEPPTITFVATGQFASPEALGVEVGGFEGTVAVVREFTVAITEDTVMSEPFDPEMSERTLEITAVSRRGELEATQVTALPGWYPWDTGGLSFVAGASQVPTGADPFLDAARAARAWEPPETPEIESYFRWNEESVIRALDSGVYEIQGEYALAAYIGSEPSNLSEDATVPDSADMFAYPKGSSFVLRIPGEHEGRRYSTLVAFSTTNATKFPGGPSILRPQDPEPGKYRALCRIVDGFLLADSVENVKE